MRPAFDTFSLPRVAAAVLLTAAAALPASAHDYPTADRVVYVQECMRMHPGPHYEMLNKCSCALDKIATEVPLEQFVTMNTATNANSIGGERGNYIRDTESLQGEIKRYRALQTKAKQSCFINLDAK
jgi:hypothetical protein